jgi:hypothetical protein
MATTYQITLNGLDQGGFLFQNVFHMQSDGVFDDLPTQIGAAIDVFQAAVETAYKACMPNSCRLLTWQGRIIDPVPSYTMTKIIDAAGARDRDTLPGAVAGCIKWLPSGGTATGRTFVACPSTIDFPADVISGEYETLLQALSDAVLTLDGTSMTHHWRFGIWNRETPAFLPVLEGNVLSRPTSLNKRMRA